MAQRSGCRWMTAGRGSTSAACGVGEVSAVRGALVTAVTGARAALCAALRPFRPLVEIPAPGARFTTAEARVDAAFLARALGHPRPAAARLPLLASAREARPGPAPAQNRARVSPPSCTNRTCISPQPPPRADGRARRALSRRCGGRGRGRVGRWWRAATRRASSISPPRATAPSLPRSRAPAWRRGARDGGADACRRGGARWRRIARGLLVLWDLEGRAALVVRGGGSPRQAGGAAGRGARCGCLRAGAGGAGAGGVELNIFDGSKDRAEWAEGGGHAVVGGRAATGARGGRRGRGGAGGGEACGCCPWQPRRAGGARELFQAADVSCLAARELAPAGAGVGAGAGAGAEVLLVATGARDGSVRVWGVRGGAADDEAGGAVVLSGHSRAASAVAVLGARCVVSGGADADVRVWDPLAPRPCVQVLRGHAGRVEQVWTDGTQVVSAALAGGADGGHHEIRVWNVRSGQCAAVLRRAPSLRGLEGPTAPAPAAPAPAARVAAMRVLHNVRPRRLPHPRRPASCGARRVARCAERERARARRQPLTLVTLDGAGRLTIWTRAEAARLPQAPPRPPAPEPARARARAPRLTKGFNCAQLAPGAWKGCAQRAPARRGPPGAACLGAAASRAPPSALVRRGRAAARCSARPREGGGLRRGRPLTWARLGAVLGGARAHLGAGLGSQ